MLARWTLLALVVIAATPAFAQSTRARLDDLDLRVGQLEETVRGQALVELSQRVDALATDVRALRGDLEMLQRDRELLQRDIESMRRQQADFIARVEQRLTALENRAASVPDAATASTETASDAAPAGTPRPAGEQPAAPPRVSAAEPPEVLYGRAFDALKAARYPEAVVGMSEFIERHPEHPLVDNAYYWLGQTYYVTRDYAKAIEAFAAVGRGATVSAKTPDALLKRGLCEVELGRTEAARASFEQVLRRFPQNEAARLAREQLQRLR